MLPRCILRPSIFSHLWIKIFRKNYRKSVKNFKNIPNKKGRNSYHREESKLALPTLSVSNSASHNVVHLGAPKSSHGLNKLTTSASKLNKNEDIEKLEICWNHNLRWIIDPFAKAGDYPVCKASYSRPEQQYNKSANSSGLELPGIIFLSVRMNQIEAKGWWEGRKGKSDCLPKWGNQSGSRAGTVEGRPIKAWGLMTNARLTVV